MELEELKERYKMLPMWARLTMCAVIGLIPAAYVYVDEGDALQANLVEAQGQEEAARGKFEKARQRKANLPKLEEQLAFTHEQLLKAKKKLPDSYRIEDVLEKAATIAKETGVKLLVFDPGDEVKHRDEYNYVEAPITTEIEGRFNQIAAFFDKIVHLESSIFLKKIELTRDDAKVPGETPTKTGYQLAKEARAALRVHGKFDLVVFRGMSDAEAAEGPEDEEMNGLTDPKAAGKKPPKPPKDEGGEKKDDGGGEKKDDGGGAPPPPAEGA